MRGVQTRAAIWLALGGAAIGVVGLIGWMSGTSWLVTIVRGLPPIMPNTALALVLMGGATAIRLDDDGRSIWFWPSMLAALIVLAISLGALLEYSFPINLDILRIVDRLVHRQLALTPTNPSVIVALSLLFLALAILLLNVRV